MVRRQHLSIDVHECHGHSEENRGALLKEEDVPYAQARLQRQRVYKEAEEPLRGDTGHMRSQSVQVRGQARKARIHQMSEHKLVHLAAPCRLAYRAVQQ